MADEQAMKQALQAYVDGFNRKDAAAVAALFADDATVEDPVGGKLLQGRAQVATFYENSMATGATLKLVAPIRGSHGNAAAMAFDVELKYQGQQMVIRVIDVFTFDAAGKFSSMKAYWGPGDMLR